MKNMDCRICVVIEDDVHKKLRMVQAELIKNKQKSFSLSNIINIVIRKHFEKNG